MNKFKNFAFVVVILVITLLIVGNWATPAQANRANIVTPMPTSTPIINPKGLGEPVSEEQQEELKAVVQAYFEIRYQSLSASQPYGFRLDDFGGLVSDESDAKAFMDAELGKLALEIKYAELNRSRYVDYKYFLDFSDFIMDNVTQLVTLSVVEDNEIIYEISAENDPVNPLVTQMSGLKHTIALQREQDRWKIVSDYYNDFLWRTMRQREESVEEELDRLSTIKTPPIAMARSRSVETEAVLLPDNPSSHDYNRDDAVQYALDHAEKAQYNPNYPDYDNPQHGDCTNFVSQALYEGGNVSMDIPNPPVPGVEMSGWYLLNDLERASDWNDVDRFYEFVATADDREWATEGPEGYELGPVPEGQFPSDLLVGDVIQYNKQDDAYWEHSAIVVAFDTNGDPIVASHSPNVQQAHFMTVVQHEKMRFIHIERSDGNLPIKTKIASSTDDWGPNPLASCASISAWNEIYFGVCPSGSPITSGFRFNNVQIPQGAQLKYAYISFTVDGPYGLTSSPPATPPYPVAPISVNIYEQNYSGTVVTWDIRGDQSIDYDTWDWKDRRTTPDLQTIIEAAISGGWQIGNSLSIMFTNNGENNVRRVMAYDRLDDGPLLGYLPARLIAAYSLGDETTLSPNVVSITRTSPDPTNGTSVGFTVTFSESVTDVDTSDFTPNATGITGAFVTDVSGSGSVYTVTVNTGTGNGTIRLDLIDNDSILDATLNPLGGVGAGNGNFTVGEVYTVDRAAPIVSSSVRAGANPTDSANMIFTVTFSESVTGVNASDFTVDSNDGGANATITQISGSGNTYTVTVRSTAISDGAFLQLIVIDNDSIVDNVGNKLGGTGLGNGDFTTGQSYTIDRSVTFQSTGANDGWILESTETSSAGGTLNTAATTFNIGDDVSNKQYRAILHFDTSSLPDNAVITYVGAYIKYQGVVGTNPFNTHGNLLADIREPYFGTTSGLVVGDFQATASKLAAAIFVNTSEDGYEGLLDGTEYQYINPIGPTQFRLRFATDDNNDLGADYVKFYSGDAAAANRPLLLILYYVP